MVGPPEVWPQLRMPRHTIGNMKRFGVRFHSQIDLYLLEALSARSFFMKKGLFSASIS